ncbi:MAG: chromate resistance protein [Candidatus Rokubacteria bacterium]|nr:chromate resistance protein [Candidatus Rokubacteria bacterium]
MDAWLLLILSLPPQPSSIRVRVWRRLQAQGAVALKNSVYLLPFTPENYERFQWLTQEVAKGGGEATLLKVDRIENMRADEVIRLFHDARDDDYRRLAERYRKLLRDLDRKAKGMVAARRTDELARLTREAERLREIDFFDAPGYQEVKRLKETLDMRLHPPGAATTTAHAEIATAVLQGRRWVTRPRPHVDRIASAWLIKRFIDPEAEFLFAPPEGFPADAIPFDALGAEFGHQGEDCTFETILKRCGLRDGRLAQLGEIVHEVDLRDLKFPRDEARGLDLVIRGLLAALKDDQQVLAHGLTLFDGLYATIGERA